MELQRGVCSLCAESTRVLTSSDAEQFSNCLPNLFSGSFLTETEFQTIKNAIKICGICCHKIQIAEEAKSHLNKSDENHVSDKGVCHFCNTDKCVMQVDKTWKYFSHRTESYLKSANSELGVCPRCLFYFDVIFSFKSKLLNKFPKLVTQKKKKVLTQKQNDTPKRKSLSNSPPGAKKRKIFDNCFDYLQPLCNNNYCIEDELKEDKRLYRGIAYVDLRNAKNFEANETPKLRPIIKIKLKPKGKKSEKVLLSQSADIPKDENNRTHRRHSCIGITEPSEEKLDETPKSAIVSNLVPKRRVSTFIDNGENQETSEIAPVEPEEIKPSTELPPEESTEAKLETSEETTVIETNGVDKSDQENTETEEKEEKPKEDETVTEAVNGKKEEPTEVVPLDSPSPASSPVPSPRNDSDSSDKDQSKDNIEQDGLERKKKRVTFSDEIMDLLN